MIKMNGIALSSLGLFLIMNVVNLAHSRIVSRISATPEDVDSLISIKPGQELPLIVFKEDKSADYVYPVGLHQLEIEKGRIWSSGTELYATPSADKQIYLCPHSDPTKRCLIVQVFGQQSQILQCSIELKPWTYDITNTLSLGKECGPKQDGILVAFGYKICEAKARLMSVFSFCYRQSHREIAFVQYKLNSSKLLAEKLLSREQEIIYNPVEISGGNPFLPFLAYGASLDNAIKMKRAYQLQYLIPPENMAFAAWKKATYHYANQALQHKTLFKLWNDINGYIRKDAMEWCGDPRNTFTGIVEIPEYQIIPPMVESNLYNIWITVMIESHEKAPAKSLVILMNNFITQPSNIDDQNAAGSSYLGGRQYIDELCGDEGSNCVESLTREFTLVGGEVRCCTLSELVMNQFSIDDVLPMILPDGLVEIENINALPRVGE